jgi:hydrogenase maturation protease
MESSSPILVLGIGNYLLGDEGVGVHAARALSEQPLPDGVSVVDGGTGGFHLLEYFHGHPAVVLIDATMDGKPAGTIEVRRPRFASDFPRALSAHDIGLRDLIESAALTRDLPTCILITISIDPVQDMTVSLSPPVAASLPAVLDAARDAIRSLRVNGAPA